MSDYVTAWDELAKTIGEARGISSGSITEMEHLTIDQRLKALEIVGLLSIAQELSGIRHGGISPDYQDD